MIPPAWQDVWITPYPNGHLQAVGTDDAGRRQYLYHPAWREPRDARSSCGCWTSARRCRGRASGPRRPGHARDAAGAGVRGRRPAARPRLLPDRQRRLRRREQQLRPDHPASAGTCAGARTRWCSLHRQVRRRAPHRDRRRGDHRGARGDAQAAQHRRPAAGLEGRPHLARHRLLDRQRLHPADDRARGHRQGLPHLARHRARRGGAGDDRGAGRDEGVTQARGRRGDEGGLGLPRQHPDAGPLVVRRPARRRRLRGGPDDRRDHPAPLRQCRRASGGPGARRAPAAA